ncbi:hypothetical protein GCM10010978_07860 [Compostibacillus humi]|uniref:DUF123 domain-containing protein n=1 Tax=Compostibacillus humi TaxID=1245525 RepID=A0A8J3EJK0_9BACI|nr:GIY-YIG nuclease family protein [Compostibacillus humi]GGH71673.1 hypothetical protein GCM10010978_07860 [Compostibacillus humi]HLT54921.1 GIY-YIG nuclease family protein [Bacillota bacterium]
MRTVHYHPDASLYAIKGVLTDQQNLTIGKLGSFRFPPGLYVYVGSAKRNIRSRIERHLKVDKKCHWHFDYLRPYLEITEVHTFPGQEGECGLFQRLLGEQQGKIVIPGFGSSDCTCKAHLFFVPL